MKRVLKYLPPVMAILAMILLLTRCNQRPAWEETNSRLISQHELERSEIAGLPDPQVPSNLPEGEVTSISLLEKAELYPGVNANLFWGSGIMGALLTLEPEAGTELQVLDADRIAILLEGSAEQIMNDKTVQLQSRKREVPDGEHSLTPRNDFIYLEKGTVSAVKAGPEGAIILELYSPVRPDYLIKAGIKDVPPALKDIDEFIPPNITPGQVYDLYDIQMTRLADGAYSRLISGRNMQLSFISMAPGSFFPHHIHPQEQIMFVLRGECEEILLDSKQKMSVNDIVRIPGNMVHGAEIGPLGCDALDIFWPARPDYLEKEKERLTAYHSIIPEDTYPELVIDGEETSPKLTFSEGPKWMNGKLYFSNMYFDQDWTADPSLSSIVEMDPNGTYRNITEGKMQANGLYPYKDDHLIVCDMIGHRVVEMTTNGEVVAVLADEYNGKPIDGPNDVVTDAKGGFYFTDPQFTMEAEKFQPGRAVYYVNPEGKIQRIVEPNEFAMPNGVLLSPDGKTLYINNCYDDESWYPVKSDKDNFVWAYDVNDDGSISNGRKFAELFLTAEVMDRQGKSSSADGMAIDKEGNVYVATYYGVQIFNSSGEFLGMINLPSFPVSLAFGDEDMKTLYIVSYSKVYRIRTNKEGYINYL